MGNSLPAPITGSLGGSSSSASLSRPAATLENRSASRGNGNENAEGPHDMSCGRMSAAMVGNTNAAGPHLSMQGNSNALGNKGGTPQVPSPDGSPCIREQCQKELASKWFKNQNGPGYACASCYNNFGGGRQQQTPSSWPSPSSLRSRSS